MFEGALLSFVLALLVGGVLAGRALGGARPAGGGALVHAALATAGLVLLSLTVAGPAERRILNDALALFALTAVGGLLLLGFRLRRRQLPAPFIVLHGALAVISVLVLAVAWHGA